MGSGEGLSARKRVLQEDTFPFFFRALVYLDGTCGTAEVILLLILTQEENSQGGRRHLREAQSPPDVLLGQIVQFLLV